MATGNPQQCCYELECLYAYLPFPLSLRFIIYGNFILTQEDQVTEKGLTMFLIYSGSIELEVSLWNTTLLVYILYEISLLTNVRGL